MAAPATKTLTPAPEPATPLERLHAGRAGLTSELAALSTSSSRLSETANAEAAVLREIGELGSAEIAAMKAWAAGGCVGDPPAPDQKQRRALAEKLAAAQAGATAVKVAGADIDQQISGLNDKLRAIADQIEKAALDAMQAEFGGLNDQHLAATEAIRRLAAKMHGLCSYLSNEGRRLIDRGEHEAGKRYLARAEALTGIKLASPGVTQGEIIEAANDWSRRADALKKGTGGMTLQEALAIAAATNALHRQPFNKLRGSVTAAQFSIHATALSKSFDIMGGTLAKARAQLDQIAADVEYLQNFTPNVPIRRMHS